MAGTDSKGSQRDFDYVDDAGNVWGVRLDESNTRLVNTTGLGGAVAVHRMPRNMTPRKVLVTDITGEIKRECIVLTLTRFAALNGSNNFELADTDPNATTTVAVTLKTPERETNLIKNFDTGKTDGTNP